MQCPHHPRATVVGYCNVCGELGCEKCVVEHEGEKYCKRHYEPIAAEIARKERHEQARTRKERQRLVVHPRDGKLAYGYCLALNPRGESFQLDLVDKHGEAQDKATKFYFNDLKAVFYVRSYDGKFDPENVPDVGHPSGKPLVVEFMDGEAIYGYTMHPYNPNESRFHLIPRNQKCNNVSILVEAAALAGAFAPEEWEEKQRRVLHDFVRAHSAPGLGKEELLGDFHFHRHDYKRALKHYRVAAETERSSRLRKKLISTQYNLGVRYIKRHEYEQALRYMQWVAEADPKHEKAQKKVEQLKEHIARKHAAA